MCSIPTVPVTLMFCIDFFHLFFSPLFSSHPVAGVVMLSFYAFQYLYHCWMPVYRFCTQLWWKHVLLRCIRKLRLPCWGKPLEKKKDTLYRKKNTFLQSLKTFLLGGLWFLLAYLVFFFWGGVVFDLHCRLYLPSGICSSVTVLIWIWVLGEILLPYTLWMSSCFPSSVHA